MEFKTAYGPRERVQLHTGSESLVQQASKDETDINRILAKYRKTGLITHTAKHQGFYGEFIGAPDYHEAMTAIAEANSMFEELPATVRKEFDNDPSEFLAFVQDPANSEKMYEMGLAKRPPKSEKPPAGGLPSGEDGGEAVKGAAGGEANP